MGERAGRGSERETRREVEGPDDLAGLPPGIATRLHRNGLTTRGLVAAWYMQAPPTRPLRGIGPGARAAIGAWLGLAETARDG